MNRLAELGQTGPEIWNVMVLEGLLPCPGPGLINRSMGLFVLPDQVSRLVVLVLAGPGVRIVMITNRLTVFLVRLTVVCVFTNRVNRPCGNLFKHYLAPDRV